MRRRVFPDSPVLDVKAAAWLREHRRDVATSEVYDDLRALLATVRREALTDAASLLRGLQGAHGLIFQEAAAVCIEKLRD